MQFYELNQTQVKMLIEAGHDEPFICTFFNILPQQLKAWKKAHPSFVLNLNKWRAVANEKVKRALYHKAIGYEVDAVENHYDHKAKKLNAFAVRKKFEPDIQAIKMWLEKKAPDEFGPNPIKIEHEHEGEVTQNHKGKIEVAQEDLLDRLITDKESNRIGDALRDALQ